MTLSPEMSTELVVDAIGDSREYGRELSQAAASYIGRIGIVHKKLADCEFGDTTDRCLAVGMGPEFDCSGLVIVSACDVLGVGAEAWSADRRHVRQMASQDLLRSDDRLANQLVPAGWLPVFGAFIRIRGHNRLRPVHVGIALADDQGYLGSMVHAVAGEHGVQEGSVRGYMASQGHRKIFYLGSLNPARLASAALSSI